MTDAAASAAPNAAEPVQALEPQVPADSGAMPSFKGTKHKVKVNGKEAEVDYDELVSSFQLRQASDEKFRTAKQLEIEYQSFVKDPWKFAKKHGLDPHEVAEKLLYDKIQYENLSDSEKAKLQAETERDELKRKLEELEKTDRERHEEAERAQAMQQIDEDITAALAKLGRKPTPRFIARMAETMLAHLEGDGDAPEMSDVLTSVDREYWSDMSEILESTPVDELRKRLPKKVLDALRKANVDEVLSQDPMRSRKIQDTEPSPARPKHKRMSTDDYFKNIEKKFGS